MTDRQKDGQTKTDRKQEANRQTDVHTNMMTRSLAGRQAHIGNTKTGRQTNNRQK